MPGAGSKELKPSFLLRVRQPIGNVLNVSLERVDPVDPIPTNSTSAVNVRINKKTEL